MTQLMNPSQQYLLWNKVWNLKLNLYKPHTIETVYFHKNRVLHAHYTVQYVDIHEQLFWG